MAQDNQSSSVTPVDLSKWRNLPYIAIGVGGIVAVIGLVIDHKQFAFSWLLAFMFFLSLCLGGMFLSMVHHLFDASWSVATRRFCEHLSTLAGLPMLFLFIPIAILAPDLYEWMHQLHHPSVDLKTKYPLLTQPGFYISAAACFLVWWFFSNRIRSWSLRQDETGDVLCTYKLRFYSATGIILFAITLTLAAIVWIQGVMFAWYSTMFGVWYFAGSMWTTMATVYVITMLLQRTTALRDVVRENTYYMIGSLLFAFTVFWAYVSFAQYFIIWNANMPEETFWYVLREKGSWWFVGAIVIIFGHFFMPFLALLRIDVKLKLCTMLPICAWAWLMHFIDLEFQIMPAFHKDGILSLGLLVDVGCFLFIGGVLTLVFLRSLNRHPVYPIKDPRMAEALNVYVAPGASITVQTEHAK
jgi:hypothetical protein